MTTKYYALTKTDGGVAVMQCFGDSDPAVEIERWAPAARAKLTGTITPLSESDLPTDRTFRDAWVWKAGQKIAHDMAKARTIHMDRIRSVRDKALDKLDKDHTRAVGQGRADDADNIEAERQKLRDIPQSLDLNLINDTATLHNTWPAGLPKP